MTKNPKAEERRKSLYFKRPICKNCGKVNPKGTKICVSCGKQDFRFRSKAPGRAK